MRVYLETVKDILSVYWGSSIIQWMFYLSILITFVKTDNLKKRIVFCFFPLLVYIFMLSPIWIYIGNKIWSSDSVAYFCRQYSLVPVFYSISYAMVLLVQKLSATSKLVATMGICLSVIMVCPRCIYIHEEYGFQESENIYKLPTDLILVCDYLKTVDEDPVVSLDTNLAALARQYDASLHLLVGPREYNNKLSKELSSLEPDVEYIMQESCRIGGDFVIALNRDSVRALFENKGYVPCFETKKYLVYECGGYLGFRYVFDEEERVTQKVCYNENGEVIDVLLEINEEEKDDTKL